MLYRSKFLSLCTFGSITSGADTCFIRLLSSDSLFSLSLAGRDRRFSGFYDDKSNIITCTIIAISTIWTHYTFVPLKWFQHGEWSKVKYSGQKSLLKSSCQSQNKSTFGLERGPSRVLRLLCSCSNSVQLFLHEIECLPVDSPWFACMHWTSRFHFSSQTETVAETPRPITFQSMIINTATFYDVKEY